mmetsp:Transcript_7567/g.18918  ORF Transcript_7567/g.18918 Transcript_7567/m.18918 type:complete len:258 (-) Transcript_7567:876-1649(-)
MGITVTSPGVCMAMCLSEQLARRRDGHGLLFGAVTKDVVEEVTDRGSKRVTRINVDIQAFAQVRLFKEDGTLDQDALHGAVGERAQRMIGWFSFRANSPLRPSLRELKRHAQVEALQSAGAQGDVEGAATAPQLLVLLSTSATQNGSTQSFDHRVLLRQAPMGKLSSVDLSITNLRHDSQAEYSSFTAASRIGDNELSKELSSVPNALLERLEAFASSKQALLEELVNCATEKAQEELKERDELERVQREIEELKGA